MRSNHNWLRQDTVLAIHEAQIAEHGGSPGIRDLGLLESALARAQNSTAYRESDVPALAALYALGVVKNHPFVDGNKRVGLVLLELFLDLHGYRLCASDSDCYASILAVAAGNVADDDFITWVREHTAPAL